MSKCRLVKELIEELFKDGDVHTIEEITLLAIESKIIRDAKDSAVKNALFQMKRDNPNIINVDKGKYQARGNDDARNKNSAERFEKAVEYLLKEVMDLKKFDWVNCTDEELLKAREKIAKLKKIGVEVQKLIKR
ncbi:MAG: hypothetical protein IJX63_07485 [Lachnospiraceae bacterium]|nr:hypothetical protein [Lachnospiraceae bacterium]